MKYARSEKTSSLSDLLPPENQKKDRIRLRKEIKDYLNHAPQDYDISCSSFAHL